MTQISSIRVSHYLSRGRLFFRSSLISTLPLESNCILKITFRPQIFISTITCSRNRTCNFISIYDDENKCFYWNIILYKLHLRNNIILSLILIRLSHTMFCQLSRFHSSLAYVLFCARLINSILNPNSTYLFQKKHCHWKLLVYGSEYLQQQINCVHRHKECSIVFSNSIVKDYLTLVLLNQTLVQVLVNSILSFKILALNLLNVHRTEHKPKKNVIVKVDRTLYETNVWEYARELCRDGGRIHIIQFSNRNIYFHRHKLK